MIATRHLNIASSFCEKLHVNTPQIPQLMANILHHTKNVNSQRWNLSDLYFILVYVSIYQNTVQCILIVIFLFFCILLSKLAQEFPLGLYSLSKKIK